VPGYQVQRPLGAGTYGEVWQAAEEGTGRSVAIKFFLRASAQQWQLLAEVKQLAQLDAVPGIVQLKEFNPQATPPYYVMAFAEQGSLADRLEKGPLPVAEALDLFRQVTEALAYVHVKGIRHCDLKPANVLLDARGRALLADFGQAQLASDASPALGTFFYMAPEQADTIEQVADTRWDVYGLGALLYRLLTGSLPRDDAEIRGRLAAAHDLAERLRVYRDWLRSSPRPTAHRQVRGVDADLAEIIDRCLEIDPAGRPRDAGVVLLMLVRRERRQRQRPLLIFAALASLVCLLIVAGLGLALAHSGLSHARDALVRQLEHGDLVRARLVGDGLQDVLEERIGMLERVATDPRLLHALKARDRAALRQVLTEFHDKTGGKLLHWNVIDDRGRILVVVPPAEFPDIPYSWRDWFNGGGDRVNARDDFYPPIRKTHLSHPYTSVSTDREEYISLSTPIGDPLDGDRIMGVLMVDLAHRLDEWLMNAEPDDGFTVLLNERGHCLLHREQEKISPRLLKNPPDWSAECEMYRRLLHDREQGVTRYTDPIDGRTYFAGYYPMKDRQLGWGVVVQHEEESALRPLDELRRSLLYFGLGALGVTLLLLVGAWSWLFWTLRRRLPWLSG
jgi:hypothetical protein